MQGQLKDNRTSTPLKVPGVSCQGLAYLVSRFARAGLDRQFLPRDDRPHPATAQEALAETAVVLVPDTRVGEALAGDLAFFLGSEDAVARYFGWEILPFDALSPTVEVSSARLSALARLMRRRPTVVVASVDAMMQRTLAVGDLAASVLQLSRGNGIDRDDLVAAFDAAGYVRASVVEERGQLAVRGAVVDLFPPDTGAPIRLELFGDTLQSIRTFDAASQRSLSELSAIEILPVREFPVIDTSSLSAKLLARARELDLSSRELRMIEEAASSGSRWPGMEHLLPLIATGTSTLWDYIPTEALVVAFDEPALIRSAEDFSTLVRERAERAQYEGRLFPEPASAYANIAELQAQISRRVDVSAHALNLVSLDELEQQSEDASSSLKPMALPSAALGLGTNRRLLDGLRLARNRELPFEPLADAIRYQCRRGYDVVITVSHGPRLRRLSELLASYEIASSVFEGGFTEWQQRRSLQQATSCEIERAPFVTLIQGYCSAGLVSESERFQLIVDAEIFPESAAKRRGGAAKNVRRILGDINQFKEGDFVVHVDHGIACYRGLRQMTVEGKVGDYLHLEYAEGAKLFLPVDHIGKVQKFVGSEGLQPALTKLGSKNWAKAKAKVKETVAELAGHLVTLYAQREVAKGISFGSVGEDDQRFADTFPFEETPDQQKAIDDILGDMARSRPMDRLVCGDVGYGKTEVALRAAFKAANAGKQVALLVPTTVLADQHFKTFRERFADFPLTVGCISRFFSTEENRETLRKLATGEVDIIIGTHRLLQRDVIFHDLGLLIIDEEHRFGVAHKEKLKRMRSEVDVLTLTATPIPRTLHMSLVGIRDLSVIETAPCDRQVTRTYLATYEESIVREAILRELQRSGQVFYIHNRVETIAAVAAEVQALVPEAKIAFAHGQMKDGELEPIMHRFLSGEIQVLVSTTIVESGLDIPNANTIIIRDADRFGLAELYQLRGRVGRSSRRAYAYLLISDPQRLGPDARKRLQVLQALDDLGMGFRLALQDMEIRGAGNLLGKDQSGHIELVGFELYSRILKEAIRELQIRDEKRGGSTTTHPDLFRVIDPEMHVGFPAHIPPFYIPDVAERLLLYQRLVDLRDGAEGIEIAEEIQDRFGNLPREVELLVELMVLRGYLRRIGAVALTFKKDTLRVAFHPEAVLDTQRLVKLIAESRGRLKLSPDRALTIRVENIEVNSPHDLYQILTRYL